MMTVLGTLRLAAILVVMLPGFAVAAAGNPQARDGTPSQPEYDMLVERDVFITLRDGVRVSADIYRPKADGRFPVLVEGSAYNKMASTDIRMSTHTFFVPRGYVFIIWNTRGRFKSGGNFNLDSPLGPDGYDVVEWASAQAWSNGKVALVGKSYSGRVLFQTAATVPPHLVCAVAALTQGDLWRWHYRGGAMEYGFATYWASVILGWDHAEKRMAHAPDALRRWRDTLNMYQADPQQFLEQIPAIKFLPSAIDADNNLVRDWASNPANGPYWRCLSVSENFDRITIPILHIGGWFDIFLAGSFDAFECISSKSTSVIARDNQRLLIGPWHHSVPSYSRSRIGAVDYGPQLRQPSFNTLRLAFLDYWLKDIRSPWYDEQLPVRYFTMHKGWAESAAWPPPGGHTQRWFLQAGKTDPVYSLNDGGLSPQSPPEAAPAQTYAYDPVNPLPTRGGAGLLLFSYGPDGLADYGQQEQGPVDKKSLTFTSAPLPQDMTVTGPVSTVLHAASSAVDTDWVVRLNDVSPDGSSLNVAEGILRARYRNSGEAPQLMCPGKDYLFAVDMGATSYIFRSGHRLRLTVNSSSFPRWSRNMNVASFPEQAEFWEVARNTIFVDAARPSHLLLPVAATQ